jgi:hypothetical protein
MQITKSKSNEQENKIAGKINGFFSRFEITKILNESNIKKIRGFKVKDIIIRIAELPFMQKNFYQGIVNNKDIGFGKTVAYDLLNNSRYNWRLFLYKIVAIVINTFIKPLTTDNRESVFIIDDSAHPRNSSKKVELLAKVYDHVAHKFFKGFRLLPLCWSDGNSLIPVDFALLSSNKAENRYQGINEKIDKRSCGYKRRMEAISKSTELIVPMLKRAFKKGIKAKYLLIDSWYGMPALIASIKPVIDVICMIKNTPKVFYYKNGKGLTISQIYKGIKKRRGIANIKGSEIVEIGKGDEAIKVKIVFVKNRNNKREWLSILSTDISLSDAEIVRIYGKRWDIEVFFKMMKQCLNLGKEVELRSYDGMIAHITIVMLRYIFLTVEQRNSADGKTFGGVYLEMIDEMKDITVAEALIRILALAFKKIRDMDELSEEIISRMLDIFMGLVMENYQNKALAA